jgi:hypothetical protein
MELILPRSALPKYRCTMPGCEATFTEDEHLKYVHHCRDCSNSVDDKIQTIIAEREANVFTSIADKEQYRWHRTRGGK